MKGIVQELRENHRNIESCLQRAVEKGIVSAEAKEEIARAGTLLRNHIAREETTLCNVLRGKAREDQRLGKTLFEFTVELRKVKSFAQSFFDTPREEYRDIDFACDFGKLKGMVLGRLLREERVLFQEYGRVLH